MIELDEVWSFVGSKQQPVWLWFALERTTRRILGWVVGDRSQETAFKLWDALPLTYEQRLKATFCTDLFFRVQFVYDDLYDTAGSVEPCEEPAESGLRWGLDWDEGNRKHFRETARLTPGQVETGIEGGYVFLEADLEHDCRYRYLFQPEPPLTAVQFVETPVFRLIIDTSRGTFRPVTAFRETNARHQQLYLDHKRRGELE